MPVDVHRTIFHSLWCFFTNNTSETFHPAVQHNEKFQEMLVCSDKRRKKNWWIDNRVPTVVVTKLASIMEVSSMPMFLFNSRLHFDCTCTVDTGYCLNIIGHKPMNLFFNLIEFRYTVYRRANTNIIYMYPTLSSTYISILTVVLVYTLELD